MEQWFAGGCWRARIHIAAARLGGHIAAAQQKRSAAQQYGLAVHRRRAAPTCSRVFVISTSMRMRRRTCHLTPVRLCPCGTHQAGKKGRNGGQQGQPQRWMSTQQRDRQCARALPRQTTALLPTTHLGLAGCGVLGAEGLLGAACGHVHVAALVVAEAEDVLQSRVGEWQARKRLTAGCCM